MLVQVVIESKGRSERRLIDVTTGVLTIGRAPTCTLPIESTLISRTHVSVDMNGRRMRVTDSSTNGTLAGDRFVRGSSEDVPFGVPIVLGDHTVWLEASDPGVAKTFESASEKAQKPTAPEPQPARETISTRTRARRELEGAPTPKPSAKSSPRNPADVDTAVLEVLAPVRPFLDDPTVREIVIHGPDRIYVERRGRLERVPAAFADDDALLSAIRSLSQHLSHHVARNADDSRPIVEGWLPDGSRVVAVLSPIAHDGPHVAIRRPRREPWTIDRLIELGSLTRVAGAALEAMVGAKLNILVAGRSGSGKTALLGALTQLVPGSERVVVIEDPREMLLETPHVVRLEARTAGGAPDGETRADATGIRDVLCAALLLRPDRLVIGDVRGAEAGELAQAMTGGREGFMGCLYASDPLDALSRLETMWMTSDSRVPIQAMRRQIGAGVQLIVQTSRMRDGSAKVTHITEVAGFDLESQRYGLRDLFVRGAELEPTGVEPAFLRRLREHGVELPAAMTAGRPDS